MKGIPADNDVEGYVGIIHTIWLSDAWRDLWNGLGFSVQTFETVGLPENPPTQSFGKRDRRRSLSWLRPTGTPTTWIPSKSSSGPRICREACPSSL